jgi:hypothetical protein
LQKLVEQQAKLKAIGLFLSLTLIAIGQTLSVNRWRIPKVDGIFIFFFDSHDHRYQNCNSQQYSNNSI